jgi:hypothetical protein
MKIRVIHFSIAILLPFLIIISSYEVLQAQDQNVVLQKEQDKWTFNLPNHGFTSALVDTVRPTLSNFGKGLLHYDGILLKGHDKMYLYQYRMDEKPVLVKGRFSESDLKILERNLLFMEKQYEVQIKEWIRKDKWDLHLGEAIKGFYMKPIY